MLARATCRFPMRTSRDGATRFESSGRVSLRVFSEIYIDRPPHALWSLFADVRQWSEWSPICRSCVVAPPGALEAGAILTMRLHFVFFAADVRVRLSCVRPDREICWEATHFGVRTQHRYTLRPQGRGSILSNDELFAGLTSPLRHIVCGWFQLTNL